MNLSDSGTADGDIVIEAENEQGAVLNGFFHGRNVSHITVDGFDISNPEPENPEIAQGVVFYESHNITVSDNVVHDSFGGGIAFNQSDSTLIEGNTVNGNGLLHPDAHSGISVYQPQQREDADGEYGVIIRNNISFDNASLLVNQEVGTITDGSGIVLDDFENQQQPTGNGVVYDRQALVESNVTYDNGGHGIHVFQSDGAVIRNNTAFGNGEVLGHGAQLNLNRAENVSFFNNIASAPEGENAFEATDTSNFTLRHALNASSSPPTSLH